MQKKLSIMLSLRMLKKKKELEGKDDDDSMKSEMSDQALPDKEESKQTAMKTKLGNAMKNLIVENEISTNPVQSSLEKMFIEMMKEQQMLRSEMTRVNRSLAEMSPKNNNSSNNIKQSSLFLP